MHAHLSGNVPEYLVAVFQSNTEGCIGQIFYDLPLHLDDVFLRHSLLSHWKSGTFEICLFQQAFVLVRHDVSLNLRHEVHRYDNDNQQ